MKLDFVTKDSEGEMAVDYIGLGFRVRRQRMKKKMTQAHHASSIESSTHHITNIEHAKTKVSLEKVVNIANALECTVDELLCDSIEETEKIFKKETVGLLESFSDVELRALPEFLRSYRYYCKLMEKKIQQKDV